MGGCNFGWDGRRGEELFLIRKVFFDSMRRDLQKLLIFAKLKISIVMDKKNFFLNDN